MISSTSKSTNNTASIKKEELITIPCLSLSNPDSKGVSCGSLIILNSDNTNCTIKKIITTIITITTIVCITI